MIDQIIREERKTPVVQKTDILVVGGGLAGVSAAVAAARLGKKVTILEKSIVLGGLATLGHVCVYLPICDGLGNRVYGGQAEEFMRLCAKYSYNSIPDCWTEGIEHVDNPSGRYSSEFNIPAGILSLDEITHELGIDVVFDTVFCDVIMDGNHCRGVIVENKSGRSAYLADYIIDASGDADVVYRAGCLCEDIPNIVSHWTYEIDMDHVKQKVAEGSEKARDMFTMRWFGLRPDADNSKAEIPMYYGTTSEGVNGYIRTSRQLALDYLKKNDRPGLAMMTLPFMPQYRMTRRLIGAEEFLLNVGHIDDSVGVVCHSMENPAAHHEFPYGALIDSKVDNIFVAGRMVSAGGYAWEIARVIPCCVFTGQVAGTAASQLLDEGRKTAQEINLPQLQKTLANGGITIHMDDKFLSMRSEKKFNTDPKKSSASIKTDTLSYH